MTSETDDLFDQVLSELDDELVDFPVAVWEVAMFARSSLDEPDEATVEELSLRLCRSLLSRADTVLVWMGGHYDRPAPHGPSPMSVRPPDEVTPDLFDGPSELLSPEPYLAILRVGSSRS